MYCKRTFGTTSSFSSGLFKREIKNPAHPWHSGDTSLVKSRHLSPDLFPVSTAPRGQGIQMTGALMSKAEDCCQFYQKGFRTT